MSFYMETIIDDDVTVVRIFFVNQSAVCKCHTLVLKRLTNVEAKLQ